MQREYIRPVGTVPGEAGSPWLADDARSFPALSEGVSIDVAVIGGGIVGALTALQLSRAGARVALIERRRMAAGVSGHSTAKLSAQHGVEWHRLLPLHDPDLLRLYAEANMAAPAEVEKIVRDLAFECSFGRLPSVAYAASSNDVLVIEREVEAYRSLEMKGAISATPSLPFDHDSLLVMPDQAVFDPAAFILGCVAALSEDAIVAEQTAVHQVEERDGKVIVDCGDHSVRADAAVLATNVPIYDTGGFFARLYPYRVYAFQLRTSMSLPDACIIPASETTAITMRPRAASEPGLWIVSGVQHKAGQGGDERGCYAELARITQASLGDAAIERHWSTQDARTADGLPFVGRAPFTKRVYMATGFAGWGMTKSVVAARLLAELVGGAEPPLAKLLDPGRVNPLKGLSAFLSENIDVAGHYVARFGRQKKSTSETGPQADAAASAGDVEPAELELTDDKGDHVATWNDPRGTARRHDAHCTHMGCVVEVNEAELTWDCPCHGSRFAADASVVHGPAREDLADHA